MSKMSEFTSWAQIALAIAAIGTVGSLYLSLGLGLKACPLCFYQRTFMMSVLAVLGVGWLVERSRGDFLCLLCFPLGVAGLGVAGFHEYLVVAGKLECPGGILGLGTAPFQSLAVFVVLAVVMAAGSMKNWGAIAGSAVLGLALAWSSVASAPPLPPVPAKPYETPIETCRPPFNR